MNKEAMDPRLESILRAAGSGALVGGGSMALLKFVHMLSEMRQRKREEMENKEEKGTITLTLPPKLSEVTKKGYGWPTMTAKWLAGLGGLGLGATVVNKLYNKIEEQKLQRKLENAQQEYLDLLTRGEQSKYAHCLDSLCGVIPNKVEKEAASPLDPGIAAFALLTILATGSAGWLGKRVLDAKLREAQEQGLELPKLKRVVFKTAPAQLTEGDEEEEEDKAAADINVLPAALGVMLDKVGNRTIVLNDNNVKKAMLKANVTIRGLFKRATSGNSLFDFLEVNPELSSAIKQAMIKTHPFMPKTPGTTPEPETMPYTPGTTPEPETMPYTPGTTPEPETMPYTPGTTPEPTPMQSTPASTFNIQKLLKSLQAPETSSDTWFKNLKSQQENIPKAPLPQLSPKAASLAGIISSITGSTIAKSIADKKPAPEVIQKKEPEPINIESIKLIAKDPEAQAYLDAHKELILNVLRKLRSQGKI